MRIKYGRVSSSLKFFNDAFLENYNLLSCIRSADPCIQFGMYNKADYQFYKKHKGHIVVVWCGSDSMRDRLIPERAALLKKKSHSHIATHDFCSRDLTRAGIPHKVIPITPAKIDLCVAPRGDSIYFYSAGSESYRDRIYGKRFLPEIKRLTGLNVIEADQHTYSKKRLAEVYKECFIALRLTGHDGVPTTVLEMGIMGRKSIFNGSVPHCIHWNEAGDISENVMKEFEIRKQDNTHISEDIRNYINIGEKWMTI